MIWMKKRFVTLLMLTFVAIVLAACGSGSTYEIDEELTVEFSGTDEYGIAVIDFAKEAVEKALKEKLKLKNREEKREFKAVIESLEIKAKPNEKLKNGDEVALELKYNEENELDITFKLKDAKYTVKDLEEVPALSQEDIFSGIDVVFDGVSPFLNAEIIENSSGEVTELFEYTISEGFFENEEEVEIIAEPYDGLESLEYKVDEKDLTKTIKVPVEEYYAESWDDLNKEDKEHVLKEIDDMVTAKVDAEIHDISIKDKDKQIPYYFDISEVEKSAIDEQYFLFIKENQYENNSYNSDDINNGVRFVYKNKITFSNDGNDSKYKGKTWDFYSVIGVNNLVLDKEDKLNRSELEIDRIGYPNIDKDTNKNENLYNIKDKFTMDAFEMKTKE